MNNEEDSAMTKVKLDFKKSGVKFGKQSNAVNTWLQSLDVEQVKQFVEVGFVAKGSIRWES